MRKSLLLSVTLLMTLLCRSQVEFGIFAGPQATSAKYTAKGIKQNTSYKFGFQLGAGLKVPFDNKVYFVPAVFYSMKGYKVTYNRFLYPPDTTAKDNNTLIHTVETAFLLEFAFNDQPGHTFFRTGPTLDFQLFGNEKFNTMNGSHIDRKMKFSFGDYGNFAANWLLQFGYETSSGFMIFGQYTYGLASINNVDEGPRIRHRAFGISIGKYFNRSKT